MGLAYVQFARRHPRLYGVMFGADAALRHAYPGLATAALDVFASLRSVIARCQDEGSVMAGSPEEHALFSWSAVHGLSSLIVEGQLREFEKQTAVLDHFAELIVHRVFSGLAATPVSPSP
jgi:hypothetical protein